MGNLGAYQWMTTVAKKVGGPVNLLLLVGTAGAGIYKISEVGVKKVIKNIKENMKKDCDANIYTVSAYDKSNEGVMFVEGDRFKVLEKDGDAVLIEKVNDQNNPYFVSAKLLCKISDYKM